MEAVFNYNEDSLYKRHENCHIFCVTIFCNQLKYILCVNMMCDGVFMKVLWTFANALSGQHADLRFINDQCKVFPNLQTSGIPYR